MPNPKMFTTGWEDYELIDAGGGKKLERWGKIITIRPEVQAYFKSEKPFTEWNQMAHWEFISKSAQSGVWKEHKKGAPKKWNILYKNLTFELELTKFKHLGIFPEQRINWDFISDNLHEGEKFLNLFAYTGAASCVSQAQHAVTTHVDSVKQLISWAKANMELSKLEGIRWVHDDALKFASREVKRGNKYKGLIMDPPAWGIGAKKEKWKLENKLPDLLKGANELIEKNGFLILNTYSPKIELPQLRAMARLHLRGRNVEVNELWMKTTTGKDLYYGIVLRVN